MRTTRTFILRLLVDTDDPQTLRGVLRPVDRDEGRSFADEGTLLALLRQACRQPTPTPPPDAPEAPHPPDVP